MSLHPAGDQGAQADKGSARACYTLDLNTSLHPAGDQGAQADQGGARACYTLDLNSSLHLAGDQGAQADQGGARARSALGYQVHRHRGLRRARALPTAAGRLSRRGPGLPGRRGAAALACALVLGAAGALLPLHAPWSWGAGALLRLHAPAPPGASGAHARCWSVGLATPPGPGRAVLEPHAQRWGMCVGGHGGWPHCMSAAGEIVRCWGLEARQGVKGWVCCRVRFTECMTGSVGCRALL